MAHLFQSLSYTHLLPQATPLNNKEFSVTRYQDGFMSKVTSLLGTTRDLQFRLKAFLSFKCC